MSDWSQADLDALPAALRRLLDDELAAGNTILEVGHHFPAAPCGAFVMLAAPVTTHPRANGDGISFYQRNSASYSGEFADPQRHFFILEAPLPPPPPPDMDAIRAAATLQRTPDRDADVADSSETRSDDGARIDGGAREGRAHVGASGAAGDDARGSRTRPRDEATPLQRFEASRVLSYSSWRDGDGMDLEALRAMSPADRRRVEPTLIPPASWREVEALAVIGSPRATRALAAAARDAVLPVRLAVARHAAALVDDALHTAMLVQALERADITSGLSEALDQMADFHPPPIVDALLRAAMEREGDVAYHCAELLAVIHGVVPSRHDWSMRPLFLRFNTDDREERRAALQELQQRFAHGPTD